MAAKGSRPGSRGATRAALPTEARNVRAGPLPVPPMAAAAPLAPPPGGLAGPGGAMGPGGVGAPPGAMKKGGKWIAGAIKHPGALHKTLGVPQGKKIPEKKLKAAEHSSNPTTARRARLATELKGFHRS